MTAWTSTDYGIITYGGTSYNFAPNELRYIGNHLVEPGQLAAESEAGIVKISQVRDDDIQIFEFVVQNLPAADRTVNGVLYRGMDTLNTLIKTTLNYRENTPVVKLPGDTVGTFYTCRFWGPFPFVVPLARMHPSELYGDGSTTLSFRVEIT